MEQETHLLSLKVLRLTKPKFATSLPITSSDSRDLIGNLLNTALQNDVTTVQGSEALCVGEFLLLPQQPINIYLGETFTSYVCVYSDCSQTVHNVNVKIDLQTSIQRLCLSASKQSNVAELKPGDTIDTIIQHEVREIGNHILVCEVSYQSTVGHTRTFRKFFKIQVLKPLDVKTKFYNAENDNVFLEAQVENITAGAICLEKVALDASPIFNVTALNSTVPKGSSFGGEIVDLQPNTVGQFLYCLTPNSTRFTESTAPVDSRNIGKLDIVWRSSYGERGRLQTSQFQRNEIDYGDLHVTVVEQPNFVEIEQVFSFKCKIRNNCDTKLELTLKVETCPGLVWSIISGQKLDVIPPHSEHILDLRLIPIVAGLITISGVCLIDNIHKHTYTFDDLGQVFSIVGSKINNSF